MMRGSAPLCIMRWHSTVQSRALAGKASNPNDCMFFMSDEGSAHAQSSAKCAARIVLTRSQLAWLTEVTGGGTLEASSW